MRYGRSFGALALGIALGTAIASAGTCHIERLPAVPVTVKDLRAMVSTRINGRKARFIIDTGSFWGLISPQTRREYHLPADYGPMGLWLNGTNGSTMAGLTVVDTFTFMHVPFHDAEFLVGSNTFPSGAAGLLGGKILRIADVEYDFGHGTMRFVVAKNCHGRQHAYWAQGRPVGVVKLRETSDRRPYLIGHARVNGKRIRVLFDTGTPRSMLTLSAARRVGITPASPVVVPAGVMGGIGRKWLKAWIVPVATFAIGNEKIEHTHLLMADMRMDRLRVGLVLGADFFLSHHIFVANHTDRLYFTYNGGPVFALGKRYLIERGGAAPVQAGPGIGGAPAASAAASGVAPGSASRARATASRSMRRGMALAAEGRYRRALADLNRACRLEPQDAAYHFRRGKILWADKQPARALADFDAAIKRKPGFYQAHLARAELLLDWKDAPQDSRMIATADINIVSLLAPDPSVQRLRVAELYARIGQYSAALRAINLWIYFHRRDELLPMGWNARCWIRAEGDRQLHRALRDCNRALDRLPKSPAVLDSRGLVYLRLGELERAIASYDAALRVKPTLASSLYGRALAELREGKAAAGHADLAAAVKSDPGITRLYAHMHLVPEAAPGRSRAGAQRAH